MRRFRWAGSSSTVSLPDDVQQRVNRVVRRSVEYAFAHREVSVPYVREHAQEMSDEVMYRHIDLYVNDFSVDLGVDGRHAVELLFERATAAGVIPRGPVPCFSVQPGRFVRH